MPWCHRWWALAILPLLGMPLAAAPVPARSQQLVRDRASFIPYRKYQPIPGKAIGVLVGDVRAMMKQEGRGGPPDAMGFSAGGGSYRWVYVPVTREAMITDLRVKVGLEGDRIKVYPLLSLASPRTVQPWNIKGAYALVEVEVNDGLGAPADEGFVATRMRQLDGTKEYPLRLPEIMAELGKKYRQYVEEEQRAIAGALAEAQRAALGGQEAPGPRQTRELMFVTWLPEPGRLRVHFRTTITDGAYREGQPPNIQQRDPLPLPVRPGALPQARRAFPPPPPADAEEVRVGDGFGIELGMAYEVAPSGEIVAAEVLPIQRFRSEITEIPPPPRSGPPR